MATRELAREREQGRKKRKPEAQRYPLHRFLGPRYWPHWMVLGLMRLTCVLPFRFQIRAGRWLGGLLHALLPKRRRIALRNVEVCFPELDAAAHREIVKKHFESLGLSVIEMALGWWGSDRKLERLMKLEGIGHLDRALAKGKGVILLTAHFTTMEASGRVLAKHSPPFKVMYRPGRNLLINEMLCRGREKSAAGVIPKDDVKAMLKALKANIPVWYAPDQAYRRKQSALVPFFGVPAMTNVATTQIARMTGATVLTYLPRRLPDDSGYLLSIGPPIENFPSDDPVADATRFNEIIEEHIRKDPAQYFWVHRKFKGRPPEYPDIYADLQD